MSWACVAVITMLLVFASLFLLDISESNVARSNAARRAARTRRGSFLDHARRG